MLFLGWYVGAVYFIMWRLKSDDLDRLEKEAEERIKMKNLSKEMQAMDRDAPRRRESKSM